MGYVPLFDTLTTGSLYGRWPDIGLWPVVLSMADRYGRIDVTPQYISGVTGLDVAEVTACLERFCAPDPDSRTWTPEDQGRRLELIEPDRKWGWQVLNHAKYREKARLLARDSERTASGMDAARKRKTSPEVPRRPPSSPEFPEFPPSDGDGDGDGDGDKNPKKILRPPKAANTPPEFDLVRKIYPKRAGGNPWPRALRAINARLAEGTTWEQLTAGTERYAAFCTATGKLGTEFVMQASTFFGKDSGFRESWELPATKAQTKQDANVAASVAWLETRQ